MESPSRSTTHALEYEALSTSSSDETQSETPPKNSANEDPHSHSALATAFPILFAAIMGRLMYQLSRWVLERGAKMVTLEQLMGSRTLGAAFLTQAELGAFNLVGLVIVFTWIWSPLGGQALLRMLGSRLETIVVPSTIVHFDTNVAPQFASWYQHSAHNNGLLRNKIAVLNSMYNAALLSPDSIRNDSQDIWGNVKIPYLSSYGDLDDPGWQRVPSSPIFEYSALVGVSINNIPVGNSSFPIESTYVYLECFGFKKTTFQKPEYIELKNESLTLTMNPMLPALTNGTWQGYELNDASWNIAIDTLADLMWSNHSFYQPRGFDVSQTKSPSMFINEAGVVANPTTLLMQVEYRSSGERPPDWFSAKCGVVQHYVESRVNCSLASGNAIQNCTVVEQRPSQKAHSPKNISFLSFANVFGELSRLLPGATHHQTGLYGLEPSLKYIQNPSTVDMGSETKPALENVPEELFSYRLGQLINSYLLIGQVFPSILGGSIDPDAVFEPNITVPIEATNLLEVYHVSRAWTGTFIFSCIVFLTGGTLSAVFVHLAGSPDVLGFVSTVVRDSKHMDTPPEAAKMDGLDLTKSMKTKRIRYGLVHGTPESEPLFGVGPEEQVEKIKKL
ncbi:hypothetical protein Neosp_013194 [[Neocosmospora] mangrovei]